MGQQHLEEHWLKPDSPTRRVIAKCCNSAMFLDFTKGHWLSTFRNRFSTGAPPLEMRVMTKERRVGVELADDLPGKFYAEADRRLDRVGFGRPEIVLGKTAVERSKASAKSTTTVATGRRPMATGLLSWLAAQDHAQDKFTHLVTHCPVG
jgi:hypothetical protein